MSAFYRPWSEVSHEKFDGFIITGAPVERMPFEEVRYWPELQRIFDWTQTNVHSTFNICWAAQAAVYHFHGVPKHELPSKAFGVYLQRNCEPSSPYLRGFSDDFAIPVSRWTEVRTEDLPASSGMRVLADSEETGLCLLNDPLHRAIHMFNHVEYDTETLQGEFSRDGGPVPANYFPGDDAAKPPQNRWRSHAHLLFGNWINEIYQTAPFDLQAIGTSAPDAKADTRNVA